MAPLLEELEASTERAAALYGRMAPMRAGLTRRGAGRRRRRELLEQADVKGERTSRLGHDVFDDGFVGANRVEPGTEAVSQDRGVTAELVEGGSRAVREV